MAAPVGETPPFISIVTVMATGVPSGSVGDARVPRSAKAPYALEVVRDSALMKSGTVQVPFGRAQSA